MLERFQTSTGVSSAQLAGGDGMWPQGGGEEGGNNRLPLRTVDTMDTNPLLVSPMEVQGVQQQVSLDTTSLKFRPKNFLSWFVEFWSQKACFFCFKSRLPTMVWFSSYSMRHVENLGTRWGLKVVTNLQECSRTPMEPFSFHSSTLRYANQQ